MDYKDHGTSDHSNRVVQLTTDLARRMKVSERKVREMRTGALLHDVGKMGVPDSVLLKPGILTDDEFEVMRKHPKLGYDLLSKSSTLKKYSEIAFCHHERWNGSGYPRGLAGTDIPLSARIFAVVDVYDALTSDRPYRPAWSKGKTVDYIKSERELTFDPGVVDAFVGMVSNES
jgi:putative nucleotidyltransferase with HDIG domain